MDEHSHGTHSMPPPDQATESNKDWRGIRQWGRRITIALSILTVILATPNFLLMLSHAEADSEVGVMFNGMMAVMTVMAMTPAVACALLMWMVGIYLDRRVSISVARWEYAVCLLYLVGVAVIARPFITRLL